MTRTREMRWAGVAIAAALAWIPAAAQAANPKPDSKLTQGLEQTVQACRRAWEAGERDMTRYSSRMARVSPLGFVEMVVRAEKPVDAAGKAQLKSLGGRVIAEWAPPPRLQMPETGRMHIAISCLRVQALAALPWVAAITPALAGEGMIGAIETEGVVGQRAREAQQRGITGAGVKVGVISDGVTSLALAQARGELPAAVQVLDAGKGDEGTAMLEIVHDVAPGADLMFHSTGASEVTHMQALLKLEDAGAQVITEDISFLFEPVFQKGMVAAVGDAIAARRTSVFSSAGNRGDAHAARARAIGTRTGPDGKRDFIDCGDNAPTNTVAIAPGADTAFDIVLGPRSAIFLQWSEPRELFPTPGQGGFTDLDLFIMDETGTRCLARSDTKQGEGRGDTLEMLLPPAEWAGMKVKLVVNVFGSFGAAQPPVLDLVWSGARSIDQPTRAGSLAPDANYTGRAVAVGAFGPLADGRPGLEPFSSAGPIQLGLTTLGDGSMGPGPEGMDLESPTLTAFDGVLVSGVGGFAIPVKVAPGEPSRARFPGTSAAAPHAAGCAALALQARGPQTTVRELLQKLTATARDLGTPGPDSITGFGLVDCDAASRQ